MSTNANFPGLLSNVEFKRAVEAQKMYKMEQNRREIAELEVTRKREEKLRQYLEEKRSQRVAAEEALNSQNARKDEEEEMRKMVTEQEKAKQTRSEGQILMEKGAKKLQEVENLQAKTKDEIPKKQSEAERVQLIPFVWQHGARKVSVKVHAIKFNSHNAFIGWKAGCF